MAFRAFLALFDFRYGKMLERFSFAKRDESAVALITDR